MKRACFARTKNSVFWAGQLAKLGDTSCLTVLYEAIEKGDSDSVRTALDTIPQFFLYTEEADHEAFLAFLAKSLRSQDDGIRWRAMSATSLAGAKCRHHDTEILKLFEAAAANETHDRYKEWANSYYQKWKRTAAQSSSTPD